MLPLEWIAWAPLLVLILVVGVYPRLLLDITVAGGRGDRAASSEARRSVQIDYGALAPEIIIAAAACLILVLDLGLRGRARVARQPRSRSALSSLACSSTLALVGDGRATTLGGMFVLDDFAIVMKLLFLARDARS